MPAPTIRSSNIVSSSGNPAIIPLPAGTAVGDLVVAVASDGNGMVIPAGWGHLYASAGPFLGIAGCFKVMTSGDIATGTITWAPGGGPLGQGVYANVTIVGSTQGGTREADFILDGFSGNPTQTVNTSSAVQSNDLGIYFGAIFATVIPAISRGVSAGSVSGASVSGALYTDASMPGGVESVTYSYGISGRSTGQSIIIVKNATSGPVSIACGSPPGGIIGSPYNHLFPTTSGVAPFTYSIISGSLPPGLTLGISTGSVTGIPTAIGTFSFTVQVVDSSGPPDTASVPCSITISAGGVWVIQEITAELIPCDPYIPGRGRFRYTVRCVDAAQATTWAGFWAALGGGGGNISSTGIGPSGSSTGAPPGPPAGALVTVADNGVVAGTEPEINFIPGTGITIVAVDDPTNAKVDVTINATSVPGTYSTLAKYFQSWTGQTSVTVPHNLGTTSVLVEVYDALGVMTQPSSITITSSNVVTLAFGVAFTGVVVVMGSVIRSVSSVYTQSWTLLTAITITHNLQSSNVIAQIYDTAGVQTQPQTLDVTSPNTIALTFGVAFSGTIVVAAVPPVPVLSASTAWTAQTTVTFTHNLNTTNVIVQVFDGSGMQTAPQNITVIDANNVQIDFAVAFTGFATVFG